MLQKSTHMPASKTCPGLVMLELRRVMKKVVVSDMRGAAATMCLADHVRMDPLQIIILNKCVYSAQKAITM